MIGMDKPLAIFRASMGHLICYGFEHIRIPAAHLAVALAAIHQLYQPETIERLGTGLSYDSTTQAVRKCYQGGKPPASGEFASLMEALQAWSLRTVQHPDDSLEVAGRQLLRRGG